MFSRTFSSLLVVFILSVQSAAGAEDFPFDQPVKQEMSGEKQLILGNYNPGPFFQTEVKIRLVAEKSYSFSAKVVGKKRLVGIVVIDPTGAAITPSFPKLGTQTAEVTAEEVNTSGRFRILVASDLSGPFTLEATEIPSDDESIESLQRKVDRLKSQLAEAEKKLNEAQSKTKQRS
jgi:hypothetical protein